MQKPKLFVSHVVEEAELAQLIKHHLTRDFLGLVDVFVSSDLESISAGANWLTALQGALRGSSALLVLCSHASIARPWVNFETGAAWITDVPIVPICHSGLLLSELPMPFSVLQGIEATSEDGLRRAYALVAHKLQCDPPHKDFASLARAVRDFETVYSPRVAANRKSASERRESARRRIHEALADPKHKWRFVETLAVVGGVTEDEVMDLLHADDDVVFGKSKDDGRRIARLKSREV
jgi:hypothetical protein